MSQIERYASKLVKNLDYNKKIRGELKSQFIDHINNLKNEYIDNGLGEKEAIKSAIKKFNNGKELVDTLDCKKLKINNIVMTLIYILFAMTIVFIAIAYLSPGTNEAQTVASLREQGNPEISRLRYYFATINLIPFTKMWLINSQDSPCPIWYINALIFIPFGALIPFILRKYKNVIYVIKIIVCCIISIHIIRLVFPVGYVSINLAILQFAGSMIGYGLFYLLFKLSLINIAENKIVN